MENREEKIRVAGETVFVRRGYRGSTVRMIAEEAGVTPALINYYFGSKRSLYKQIVSTYANRLYSEVSRSLGGEQDIFKKIELFIRSHNAYLQKNPHIPGFVFSEMRSCGDIFQECMEESMMVQDRDLRRELYRDISAAVAEKKMRMLSPLHLLYNILSMNLFYYLSPLQKGSGLTGQARREFEKKRVDEIVDLVIEGIRKK
ncbi:MAG: TetR/AcrR family transcriptional regulator [Fibrobacterota bacterium]